MSHESKAPGDQRTAPKPLARSHTRRGSMAEGGGHGVLRLPRHANERSAHNAFRHYVGDLWRRNQKTHLTWDRMTKLVADWLPPPRILHPWPDRRFAVKHLR